MAYKYLKEELILNEFQKKIIDYGMELQRLMWNSLVDNFNEKVDSKEINIYKSSKLLENHIWDNFYNEFKQSGLGTRMIRAVYNNYIQAWKNCFNTNMPNHGQPKTHDKPEYGNSLQFTGTEKDITPENCYEVPLWCGRDRLKGCKNVIKQEQMKLKFKTAKFEKHSRLQYKAKQSNIIKVGHRYFINICYEYTIVPRENGQGEIGLDWGLVDYFIDSNGKKYNLPKRATRQLNRIKCLQCILSKKTKNSKNYIKVVNKITDAWIRYNNIVRDWTEKFTTKLCSENSLIVIEDLDLIEMRKKTHKSRRRQMNHNSFCRFKTRLEQKALLYKNCRVIKVGQYFPSSQLCSNCGENTGKKPVNIRKFTCPYCGTTHDRDVNAAINILREGQRIKSLCSNG